MTRGTAPACGRQSPLPRHLVSPLGAQFPRPLPVARRALLGTRPRPPARPTALERSLRPPSSVLRSLLSLLYPASCFLVCLPETRIARQVGACTTPASKHRETPQHTQPPTPRARKPPAEGGEGAGAPGPAAPEAHVSGGCGSACGRGRGAGAGGARRPPGKWLPAALSPSARGRRAGWPPDGVWSPSSRRAPVLSLGSDVPKDYLSP